MNWLDILLIIINTAMILFVIISTTMSIITRNKWSNWGTVCAISWIIFLSLCWFTILMPFLVLDKSSGATIGIITSVDKNFFGTTALYIKTTETNEEEYCIEFNESLENKAKELIGKKVKISYGKRVGLYSTGKCSQAPVETIEEIENEISNK